MSQRVPVLPRVSSRSLNKLLRAQVILSYVTISWPTQSLQTQLQTSVTPSTSASVSFHSRTSIILLPLSLDFPLSNLASPSDKRKDNVHHPEPMLDIWLDYSQRVKEIAKRLKPAVDAALAAATSSTSTQLLSPSYADEVFRRDFANQVHTIKGTHSPGCSDVFLPCISEMAELRTRLHTFFDGQRWADVTPVFEKMYALDESGTDFETIVKSAVAYVFQNIHQPQMDPLKLKNLQRGEELGYKIIEAVPSLSDGYSIVMHSLTFQERFADVPSVFERMLQFASERSDEANAAFDSTNLLVKALIKLSRESEFPSFKARVCALFPGKAAQIEPIQLNAETDRLQEQCWKWVFSPIKDFQAGKEMFGKLVSVKPQDYWANLIYGACLTVTGSAVQGESYIRTAKGLDGNIPHGSVQRNA